MRHVDFFFIARKACHVTSSATFHSDLRNKAQEFCETKFAALFHFAEKYRVLQCGQPVVAANPTGSGNVLTYCSRSFVIRG
jgi:hypothetical protein